LASLLALAVTGRAQITIEGIADKQVVADKARFRVPVASGYEYTCLLNGSVIPTASWVEVTKPDYYQVSVQCKSASGTLAQTNVQFIVRATERGDTEWGLPPWTPYPVINSAAAEFVGAHLRLITPRDYPVGLEIPVIAFVEDGQGRPVRVNGLLAADGHPAIQLRRGVGSGFLAATHPAGALIYAGQVGGLPGSKTVYLEAATSWTSVSGALSGAVAWPDNSRIAVTGSLTVPNGAVLTVGAGTVVRLDPGVDITVNGRLVINGAVDRPVVFTPVARAQPWGGFILPTSAARLEATGAIFTGSGANQTWFDQHSGYEVHRKEQALLLLDTSHATLTDCYAVDHRGQFGHGKNGFLTLTRCLVQKFITAGEYNGGSVQVYNSALVEFPQDDETFVDGDNDGIYFTTGNHVIRDSLVGWTKDDGIDAGSGGAGSVLASNVWVEGCYHEAFAWSGGGRVVTNLDCVSLNCGQGIEAGWSSTANSPDVFANHCLSIGNLVGARFGDNYDWDYWGFLRVTNSFLLFNYRNIWGMNWDDWTYRQAQMDLRGNYLSAPDALHPANCLWPPADGWRLAPFMTTPPGCPVGLAFATRGQQADLALLTNGLAVGLSSFTTNFVSVDYAVETPDGTLARGTLQFSPGETVKSLPLPAVEPQNSELVRLRLQRPVNAEFTGATAFYFVRPGRVKLISTGSIWNYLDNGSNQGATWRLLNFDDTGWQNGPAELGFGDGDEATVINGGPSDARFATTYFRRRFVAGNPDAFAELQINLRRDDGAIVYLNNHDVFRSNMPTGQVSYATYTGKVTTSETAFFSTNASPAYLETGTNIIAVELHQADKTSSDLSFELELVGIRYPRVECQRLGGEVVLYWGSPTYILEEADSLAGPWNRLVATPSPLALTPTAAKFFRLRSE
jgi:hypothetical protein